MKQPKSLIAALILGLLSLGASAQVVGTVGQVQVGNGGIFISLATPTTMCAGGSSLVFLPTTNTNYVEYASWLKMARAFGSTVTVYSAISGDYCVLSWLIVAP